MWSAARGAGRTFFPRKLALRADELPRHAGRPMSTWVAGADGCKGGWIVVLRDVELGGVEVRRVAGLAEVLRWEQAPRVLGVDIPIGLLDEALPGGRACDRAARALLGPVRASSVFSPPIRAALAAQSYPDACRMSRASSAHGLGLSRQCFAIAPKIREVDLWLTPALQGRVVEVHPEVSFHELNAGRPPLASKKKPEGRRQRIALLEQAWACALDGLIAGRPRPSLRDDAIDALVACWTAERIQRGEGKVLPARPPLDARGLRMEIVR